MATALFGDSPVPNAAKCVTIKAGKCDMVMQANGKFMCTPKLEKGVISLTQGDDAAYTNFTWKNRDSDVVADELVLMPDSLELIKVNTGREGDRVYRLNWKNSGAGAATSMFWLQAANAANDEGLIKDFNDRVTDPRKFLQPRSGAPGARVDLSHQHPGLAALSHPAGLGATASGPPSPPPAPIGGLDFSALMGAMGGGMPASMAVPSTAASSATGAPANDAQAALRAAMSAAMGVVPTPAAPTSTAATLPASSQRPIRLEDTVTAERVLESGILSDPEVRAALVAMLPTGQDDDAALEANLRSPQLRQAMGTLTAALHSDNYNSVFANLGVDPQGGADHLMRGDVVRAFLEALRQAYPDDAAAGGNMDTDTDTTGDN